MHAPLRYPGVGGVTRAVDTIVLATTILFAINAAEAAVLRVCPSGCPYSSIQKAIDAVANDDVIAIGKGTYGETLKITDKAITLKGEGPRRTSIAVPGSRAITIACSSLLPVTLQSVTISGGSAGPTGGGGIRNTGCDVNGSDLVIDDNSSCHHGCGSNGGGILNQAGHFKLSASIVSNNTAGGIANDAEMLIKDTTIVNNSSSKISATSGISNTGSLTIRDSVIANNISSRGPGGIRNDGTMHITDSIISSNSSGSYCAGILLNGGNATIIGSTIKDNHVDDSSQVEDAPQGSGGGLCVSLGAAVTVKNSTIKKNQATKTGGGVYASDGSLTLIGSNVARNEAYHHADPSNPDDVDVAGDGGGIFAEQGAVIQLRNATVRNNTPNNCAGSIHCR